jgi:hypothetical protein
MSRYRPLAEFLSRRSGGEWEASFSEIEQKLGFSLPPSASKYAAWWANQTGSGHSQTKGWRSVGWRTAALDLERKRVRFERDLRELGDDEQAAGSCEENAKLLREAHALTGIEDREALIAEALRALVAREAALRLIRLGGTMPDFTAAERERTFS